MSSGEDCGRRVVSSLIMLLWFREYDERTAVATGPSEPGSPLGSDDRTARVPFTELAGGRIRRGASTQ